MKLFPSKTDSLLLGISVTNSLLTIVELTYHQDNLHLKQYGIQTLNLGDVVDNTIVDTEQMGLTIANLVQQLNIGKRRAATDIPHAQAISKLIELPAELMDIEIEAQIRIDADQYIPYPLAEVSFDFEVIGPSPLDSDYVQVLLVVSHTDHIEQRVDSLAFANIETKVVEVNLHAIERAFQLIYPCSIHPSSVPPSTLPSASENQLSKSQLSKSQLSKSKSTIESLGVALVDIGHTRTTIYVAMHGEFVFEYQQLFGGAQLAEAIQTGYNLDFEAALKAQLRWGNDESDTPESYSKLYFEPFIEHLVERIKQALQYYFDAEQLTQESTLSNVNLDDKTHIDTQDGSGVDDISIDNNNANNPNNQNSQIKKVLLCGDGALLPNIEYSLQRQLGLDVSIANPFIDMTINPDIDRVQLNKDAPLLMAACGLSLRRNSYQDGQLRQSI